MSARARWCHICHQTPPAGDLLHQLEAVLPEYDHLVCSLEPVEAGGFNASIKLGLKEEREVQKWVEDFQSSSQMTWRIYKTNPAIKRAKRTRSQYKVDYQCQHGGAKRSRSYIKTNCPAKLFLDLKKPAEIIHLSRRARPIDPHVRNQLTFNISLRNSHNHSVSDSLRHRDVSKETIEKLMRFFELGHNPTTALKALKNELREETGEGFEEASADRSICPELFFCYRLYHKLYPHRTRKRRTSGIVKIKTSEAAPPNKVLEQLSSGPGLQKVLVLPTPVSVPSQVPGQVSGQVYSVCRVVKLGASRPVLSWQQRGETELRLGRMFNGLLEKLKAQPRFEEPLKNLLCSYETMDSDQDLISALNSFGKKKSGNSGRAAKQPRLQINVE